MTGITNGWVLLLTDIDSQITQVIGPFDSYEAVEHFYYNKVDEEIQNTSHVQFVIVESQATWRPRP